jgi:hypothetical protein
MVVGFVDSFLKFNVTIINDHGFEIERKYEETLVSSLNH